MAGGCTSCMGSSGYTSGERVRSTAATVAFVAKQVAVVANAYANAETLIESYKHQREVAHRSTRIMEQQHGQMKNEYWPRELDFLSEFGAAEPIETVEQMGRRYAGRLVPRAAAPFAKLMHETKCNASRYCTSKFTKQTQDLAIMRATAIANARVIGRNNGFIERERREEVNFTRRMQAVGLGRGLMNQAAGLMKGAADQYNANMQTSMTGLSENLRAFGRNIEERRGQQATTVGGQPMPDPQSNVMDSGAQQQQLNNASTNHPAVGPAGQSLSGAISSGTNIYSDNQSKPDLYSQTINNGQVGDRMLVPTGAVQYMIPTAWGPTQVVVDMAHFGWAFVDDKAKAMPARGGGTGFPTMPFSNP